MIHRPVKCDCSTIAPGVKLEVLDWAGTGPPVVILAVAGSTAHDFYDFAPIRARDFRVYGIARRGLGASRVPARATRSIASAMMSATSPRPTIARCRRLYLDAVHSYDRDYDAEALYLNTHWKSQMKTLQQHLAAAARGA